MEFEIQDGVLQKCRLNIGETEAVIPKGVKSIGERAFYQNQLLENIMIPAFIAGTPNKEAKQRAKELLDFMGLTERASHKPNELSGGEKQRIAVARALVNNPEVILADEPSGSLDTQNKAELHQLFFDLRDRFGQTFVIVTHDESLASITDRTIHMRDGLLVAPQKDEVTPQNEEAAPQKEEAAPQKEEAAPQNEEVTPAKNESESNI